MAEALDALLASVRSAEGLEAQRALLDASPLGGGGGPGHRERLLSALDAERALPRSMIYLYLLDAAWQASSPEDSPRLAELTSAFACLCDPELARAASPKLASVSSRMASSYSTALRPRCSLLPLTMALRKVQLPGQPAEITPLHPLLFEAALEAQNPRAALPVLEDVLGGGKGSAPAPPDVALRPEATGVSSRDVLLTFYYAGLLLLARREWDAAAAALALALAVPAASAPSAVASEALKRWLLAHVAAGRGPVSTPSQQWFLRGVPAARSASPSVFKAVKADAAAYVELASRGAGRGTAALASAAARGGGAPFVALADGGGGDGQIGLLRAAVRGERDRALAGLSKIYAALPLGDVLLKAGEPTSAGDVRSAADVEGGSDGDEGGAAVDDGGREVDFGQQLGGAGDSGSDEAMSEEEGGGGSRRPRLASRRRLQQQPAAAAAATPGPRRAATAEARAAAVAATASFEASLLPPRRSSSDAEEAERALWTFADNALSAALAPSSVVSPLPPLAHTTLARVDAVAGTVSFEDEASPSSADGGGDVVSSATLSRLRETLEAVNEMTLRVRERTTQAKTDPELVARSVERQRSAAAGGGGGAGGGAGEQQHEEEEEDEDEEREMLEEQVARAAAGEEIEMMA